METYRFSQFPSNVSTVHIALFENVTNAPEIRQLLIRAATLQGSEGDLAREEVDFAFIEASLLVSREHLLTAITTTILSSLPQTPPSSTPPTLKTRSHNIHSEILLYLSPNNNITDSIRRHGLGDHTKRLVVVHIPDNGGDRKQKNEEEILKSMEKVVKGQLVELDMLEKGEIDWSRVDKIYKLNEMNNNKTTDLLSRKVAAIINTVAIKNVI